MILKKANILTVIKISLMLVITLIPFIKNGFYLNFFSGTIEILLIFIFSQVMPYRINKITYLLSSMLFFISLVNTGSLIFSGNYVTAIMWQNLQNVKALGSMLQFYIIGLILLVILSFLPMRFDLLKGKIVSKVILFYTIDFIAILIIFVFKVGTPLTSVVDLNNELKDLNVQIMKLKKNALSSDKIEQYYKDFEQPGISSGIDEPIDKPNVIVVFAEGFSSQVLDSNNKLGMNLTPNLDQFSKETVNFKNYYNHTAATYHGIRGQLYSSYQFLHSYELGLGLMPQLLDTKLVSLQGILGNNGYTTSFFNAEPHQATFSNYLNLLGFDKVVTAPNNKQIKLSSGEKVVSDEENYNEVLKNAEKSKSPFFISTYLFGTHLDVSPEAKKNNVKDDRANAFYASDLAFGDFWKAFKKSDLYDNTIVVFTTDHATYPDPDYQNVFKDKRSEFVSSIPLMVYYPGVQPQTIDAAGRNSLSLAPTLLDLLNQENEKNYFLGKSLFTNETTPFQYRTDIMGQEFSTYNNKVTPITQSDAVKSKIFDYFNISLNTSK